MSQLKELRGVSRTHSALFTVLSELYTNALDHGVLELDSKLKQGPGGFERYFAERTRRLAALTDGQVDLTLTAQGECLSLRVTDSGRGFASAQQAPAAGPRAPFGRGIPLVRALCDEVVYDRRGSTVEVRFPQRQGGDKSAG
jgi:anti-sigma regulatory factor (Ser/Thr protein kinase)